MSLIDKEQFINEMNTRAEEEALDFIDIRDMVEFAPTVDAIPIPEGATNGDVIKAMFPNAKVNVTKYSYAVEVKLPYHTKYDTGLLFNKDFWNALYNKEVEE